MFPGSDVLVLDARFQQRSVGVLVDLNFELNHLDVEYFHALLDVALVALGFDEDAEGDLIRLHVVLQQQFLHLESLGDVVVHNTHVHYAIVQYAVHLQVLGLEVVQPAEDQRVCLGLGNPPRLLLHALDHRRVGLLVCGESGGLHFLEESAG